VLSRTPPSTLCFRGAFNVLLYIAGCGRLPWRIKFRDYLAYVLILSSSRIGTPKVFHLDAKGSIRLSAAFDMRLTVIGHCALNVTLHDSTRQFLH
jgi:hypothetical protein